jgi:hypothetical protein
MKYSVLRLHSVNDRILNEYEAARKKIKVTLSL